MISAENSRAYKPDPAIYLGAYRKLSLRSNEYAMVAAHLSDLQAAKACSLQTIYMGREGEESWSEKVRQTKEIEQTGAGGGILEIRKLLEIERTP